MTHIEVFAVPPGEDDDFLLAWREEPRPATLYRALRDDVDFRFAELGEGGSYEVVREDGAPDAASGCVLVNPYEVAAGDDARFLAAWDAARETLARQRGAIGARLHRSAEAEFRFVDVARWSSPLMFFRARGVAAAIPFSSHPALYQPSGG